jgi:POT family proton-dependent oligopeptide transporter
MSSTVAVPVAQQDGTVLGHPRALFMLFFTELWERFSFYGMRALLVLYMTKQLRYGDDHAYEIYGAYGTLVYATPVIGGFLADRIFGYRRAIMLGAVLMAIGHFAMAIENHYAFYAALALLIAGNGMFKPNISTLVGKLYAPDDPRREGAFTIFYMGINLGAFLAPLTCGWLGENWGWHWGFGLAGVGMLFGLVLFVLNQQILGDQGLPPADRPRPAGLDSTILTTGAVCLSVPLFMWLVQQHAILGYVLLALGGVVLLRLLVAAITSGAVQGGRLLVVITLIFFSILFWAFFEQAGSSISLFTDRNVDRTVGALGEVPTSWFQAVNPVFVVTLGPIFALLWTWLARHGMEPSTPFKFALGILQIGLGFGALVIGAQLAGTDGVASMSWLVLGYLLHTTGELCLSPVGLSMVTKLSPPQTVGFVMGAWFMSSAFAHYIASAIAKLTGAGGGSAEAVLAAHTAAASIGSSVGGLGSASGAAIGGGGTPLGGIVGQANLPATISLPLYADVFWQIAVVAMLAGLLVVVLVPLLKRGMHGIN